MIQGREPGCKSGRRACEVGEWPGHWRSSQGGVRGQAGDGLLEVAEPES